MLKLARDKKALGRLQQAAQTGDAKAAYDLGSLYLWGAGVKQDFKASERWFRKSAEAGYRPAQLYLAGGYGSGYGLAGALPRDQVEGLKWMLVAQAVNKEPKLEFDIELLKRQMTPAQIAEAEQRARAKAR